MSVAELQRELVSWSGGGGHQKNRGGLVWDVMSFKPVAPQSLFCHTLTHTHQIFPSLLQCSTLASLYLNSSLTFHVYFVRVTAVYVSLVRWLGFKLLLYGGPLDYN